MRARIAVGLTHLPQQLTLGEPSRHFREARVADQDQVILLRDGGRFLKEPDRGLSVLPTAVGDSLVTYLIKPR